MTGTLDFVEVVGAITAALVSLWVVLIFLSAISYRRMMGLPLVGPKLASAVPYMRSDLALHAASERRKRLETFLREYESEGVVRREFIEIPAGFQDVRPREFEGDRRSAAAHTAHLHWQLSDNRFLLLERLVDGIVCLQRTWGKDDPDLFVTVRLAALPGRVHTSLYPWRAVVETSSPIKIAEQLKPLSEWVGIGVDLARQVPTRNLGACTQGNGGSFGQAAGVLESQSQIGVEYGVVCHHVLSQHCGSLYWPDPPNRLAYADYPQGALDAALIRLRSPCFVRNNAQRIDIRCASASDRNRFIAEALEVKKWPLLNGRRGVIEQPVPAIRTPQGQIRAPHIQVIPSFTKRFGVIWPLFGRAFSSSGDSGAWVVDHSRSLWFGMVIHGADPPVARTYALEAAFLLDAFSRALPSEAPFNPKRLD